MAKKKESVRVLENAKGKLQNDIDRIDKKISKLQADIDKLNELKTIHQNAIVEIDDGIGKAKT